MISLAKREGDHVAEDQRADDDVVRDRAGREIDFDQLMTWIITHEIRGELEHFHGGGAVDPDNPASDEGFISDLQMKALNIVIRRAVYQAVSRFRAMSQGDEHAAWLCQLQLAQVPEYMEPPGSEELEKAYREVTGKG
jgi:hypothetical protein